MLFYKHLSYVIQWPFSSLFFSFFKIKHDTQGLVVWQCKLCMYIVKVTWVLWWKSCKRFIFASALWPRLDWIQNKCRQIFNAYGWAYFWSGWAERGQAVKQAVRQTWFALMEKRREKHVCMREWEGRCYKFSTAIIMYTNILLITNIMNTSHTNGRILNHLRAHVSMCW